jgi:hypothetical protein
MPRKYHIMILIIIVRKKGSSVPIIEGGEVSLQLSYDEASPVSCDIVKCPYSKIFYLLLYISMDYIPKI